MKSFPKLYERPNPNSHQSPPLQKQAAQKMRDDIEIPLENTLPEPKVTPSPMAPDENNDDFFVLYYRVDVEELKDWATVT